MSLDDTQYHMVLASIYSVVLVSSTIGIGLMMHILQSNTRSLTTIAVLNLIFTHFLFLLTVPFRIYYYATHRWGLGLGWCKTVSAMIHIHMYMAFFFYVVILVMRLLIFYCNTKQVELGKLHALVVSAAVWMVVVVAVPCILHFCYGKHEEKNKNRNNNDSGSYNSSYGMQATAAGPSDSRCFQFGNSIEKEYATKMFNYSTSVLFVVVATLLIALQANVLLILYRKYSRGCTSQQVFWAQLKSLCFALIMIVCFIPYHMFRLHYIQHVDLQAVNEVFLSLTTLSCLDMLTFVGRGSCNMCYRGQTV
ncbi:putative G-protein coupled receptor 141 [Diretmus argenteus]